MLFKDITIIGEGYAVLEHGYLVTDDKTITYIGTEPPADYTGEVYDGQGKVLVPGMFNTHCHIPMGLMRGYGEGLNLQDWLFTRIFPYEDLLTDDDCYWGTLMGCCELIASGACSFTDMYMFMKGIISGVATSGLKANLSRCMASSLSKQAAADDLKVLTDFMKTRDDDRVKADFSIHAEYTTNQEIITELTAFCHEHNMIMGVHLSETEREHHECIERHGMTPAALFAKLGAFDTPAVAAHCVWVDDNDIDILAAKGVTVAHCPSSNMKLGSGVAPVVKLMERGVNVAIGTDGASSNNNLNILEELNLAAVLQKGVNHNPMLLSTTELMAMACKNGAKSQGRDNCGEIKVGNAADLVVYDFDRPHLQPVYDVLANLLYAAQASDVVLNMVDGRVLYKDGVFTTIDVEQVIHNVKRIRDEKLTALKK